MRMCSFLCLKVVVKGMTKAEMVIKMAMQPISPAQTFIEHYLKLLPDSSQAGKYYHDNSFKWPKQGGFTEEQRGYSCCFSDFGKEADH